MSTATTPIVQAPVRPRRRWRKVLYVVALVIVALLLLFGYSSVVTRNAWEEAEAEASLDMPRWRLLELEADRPAIADHENSALHIIAIRRKGGTFFVTAAPNYDSIFAKLTPAAQLNKQQRDLLRTELAKIAKPVEEARTLKNMPHGRFPGTYTDDYFGANISERQNARGVVEWLQHDAWLLADDGKLDEAVESCQAILNVGRAVDGDPFLMTHLIRIAVQCIAIGALERVLAQGQASDECLQKLQAVVGGEIGNAGWLAAVRGERAGLHHLFDNIRSGKVKSTQGLISADGGNFFDSLPWRVADVFPSIALKYYPELLCCMNRYVEIAKLPSHQRAAKWAEWEAECRSTRNPLIKRLPPAMSRFSQAENRNQAMLRTALAALACERYRLRHLDKEWPASLEVLVKNKLLDAIPVDPFNGEPIRYRRTKDGIVVYSVGVDLIDDKGNVERQNHTGEGIDTGIRLWNVDRRRQPAPPVLVILDDN